MGSEAVSWPEQDRPEKCVVFAHNDITIGAARSAVWSRLIAAPKWPEWYDNSRWVRLPDGDADLALGMTFTWTTFGLPITSRVVTFDADRQLGWTWWRRGARGYHGWLLRDVGTSTTPKTLVITEETQFGLLPTLTAPLMRRMLHHEHGKWLRGLAQTWSAAGGSPAG